MDGRFKRKYLVAAEKDGEGGEQSASSSEELVGPISICTRKFNKDNTEDYYVSVPHQSVWDSKRKLCVKRKLFYGFQSEGEAQEAGPLCRYVAQCRGKPAKINDYINSSIQNGPTPMAKLVDYIAVSQSKLPAFISPPEIATSTQDELASEPARKTLGEQLATAQNKIARLKQQQTQLKKKCATSAGKKCKKLRRRNRK
jgi:hypothetical protein